jgi:hypothetical protein
MASTASISVPTKPAARTGVETRAANFELLFRLGALGLLLSALSGFLGGVWDIQWHEDVGPDTFFTTPHLLLYLGAAGAGLTSLVVTLVSTWWVRHGADPDPALVPLLRRTFWAPLGFVVAGSGALVFLGFGLFDLWWHTIYGFDAVLHSPPHTGLGLGDLITLAGGIVVFAMLVERAGRRRPKGGSNPLASWPLAGLAMATAIFLINSAGWQVEFWEPVGGQVAGMLLFIALLYPIVLLMAASVSRAAGAVSLTGVAFSLLVAGGWLFSAWATPLYAASVGLFVRDNAFGYPRILAVLPLLLLPAAAAIDLLLVAARRRGLPVRTGVMLASGLGMAVLAVLETVAARDIFYATGEGSAVATAVVAALVGAVSGWAGWKLGVVLRHLSGAPHSTGSPVVAPSPGGGPSAGEDAPRRDARRSEGETGSPRIATTAMPGSRALLPLLVAGAVLVAPTPALGHGGGPVVEVHQETIDAGPYLIDIGFTEWPLRAERSLDIVFHAREGIAGKQGTVTLVAPSGWSEETLLVRHPRQREDWGFDVIALPEEGEWTFRFAVDGPLGIGAGTLTVPVGPRPGPPELVGWLPPLAVAAAMTAAVIYGWRRVSPARQPETWSWA